MVAFRPRSHPNPTPLIRTPLAFLLTVSTIHNLSPVFNRWNWVDNHAFQGPFLSSLDLDLNPFCPLRCGQINVFPTQSKARLMELFGSVSIVLACSPMMATPHLHAGSKVVLVVNKVYKKERLVYVILLWHAYKRFSSGTSPSLSEERDINTLVFRYLEC